jgi:hypothetical protein
MKTKYKFYSCLFMLFLIVTSCSKDEYFPIDRFIDDPRPFMLMK